MPSLINQNWVFGRRAGLDFSTPVPTPLVTAISTLEGCASISDANGDLVLYTDGQEVWDDTNTVRATGLLGHPSSTQSAIVVPDPGNPARYYVFTAEANHPVEGIRIDPSQAWAVTQLSSLPTSGSPTEKLTAIQHANCRDFWVLTIVQDATIGILRVFRVGPAGVQHVGDTPMGVTVNDPGYLKGSGDGKRIAIANWMNHDVLVYPFDTATGTIDLSQLVTIVTPPIPNHARGVYGVEFCGDLLYYSVLGSIGTGAAGQGFVFQYDLAGSGPSVQVGMHPNAGTPGRYSLGALQMGMDGRIYIAQDGENSLGVIATPSGIGAACGLAFGAVTLAPNTLCLMGLPNLVPNACECGCDEGPCDEAVDEANTILDACADEKYFTIIANGQSVPAGCGLAFEQADFAPLFSLHWGDGPNDRLESHDTEFVYIQVHNPYRNLLYRGVKIFNIRVTPNQLLPSGENALQLIPAEIVCFDEVEPCSHVSRDFAFLIQNAVVQGYQITFDYCIEETAIVGSHDGRAAFDIDVVAS